MGGKGGEEEALPWVMSKHTLGSEESGNLSQSKALLRLNLEVMNSWQVEATAERQDKHTCTQGCLGMLICRLITIILIFLCVCTEMRGARKNKEKSEKKAYKLLFCSF